LLTMGRRPTVRTTVCGESHTLQSVDGSVLALPQS
jgi:hypothetical protein